MDDMQEDGVSHGLLLGCPIGAALMLVAVLVLVILAAVVLGFVAI